MMIGLIGAMFEEIELLKSYMDIRETKTIAMREYYVGNLFGKEVVLVFSKYGKVAVASAVTTLIQVFSVDFVVFTGVAGAGDSTLNIGDIVIGDKLIQHDMDVSPLAVFSKYEIPLLGLTYFQTENSIIENAKKSALHYIENVMHTEIAAQYLDEFKITRPNVVVGTIASGDQFVADSTKVQALSKDIDNLKCIEMEGAALAHVCYENNIPFIVFRVISDKADEHADINFPKFVEKAARYFTKGVLEQFIKLL